MTIVGTATRQIRAALADAPDAALGRVVAMLDGLVDRGEADAVLEAVRPRLRRLRPPRPLRLARILMLPLEGALVPAANWKGAAPEIPRSAIGAICAMLETALGPRAEEIEAAALGHTTAHHAAITALGARLWPAAGRVPLPAAPPAWAQSGLPPAAAGPILALCAALWRHAVPLWEAREAAALGPPERLLRAALAPLAAEGAAPLTAGMVLLLRQAARPGLVSQVAISLYPAAAAAADREMEALLAREVEAIAGSASPAEAMEAAAALGQRLADLEAAQSAGVLTDRRGQAVLVRRDSAQHCQRHLAEALMTRLLLPAATAAGGPPADDRVIASLEEAARELRQLELAGRRLGQEAAFDKALREAVARLLGLGMTPGGLTRFEIGRIIELLAGTEAALPLMA